MVEQKPQLLCNICNTPYTGADALDKLIACSQKGRPNYVWAVGQKFTSGIGNQVEVMALAIRLSEGQHEAGYVLQSGDSVYALSQDKLQKLTGEEGSWKPQNND